MNLLKVLIEHIYFSLYKKSNNDYNHQSDQKEVKS